MTTFRSFRNDDPPALAALWNRSVPIWGTARPLSAHEFDSHVVSRPHFDAKGLIVAEREGAVVGFVHAGFGPESPSSPPMELSRGLGTIGMLAVDPAANDLDTIEDGLIREAEGYLTRNGATVLYAGGRYPMNPHYWGVYGGSEWAGILGAHVSFHRPVLRWGYEPVSSAVLMEADLSEPEVRDIRGVLIRRQTRLEVSMDIMLGSWWDALAIGDFCPVRYRLLAKSGEEELAHATTWDMTWFSRLDGRSRIGLIDMEVHPSYRRKATAGTSSTKSSAPGERKAPPSWRSRPIRRTRPRSLSTNRSDFGRSKRRRFIGCPGAGCRGEEARQNGGFRNHWNKNIGCHGDFGRFYPPNGTDSSGDRSHLRHG